MIINKLPEPVKTVALKRAIEDSPRDSEDYLLNLPLSCGFIWASTPEGQDFWAHTSNGKNPELPEATKEEFNIIDRVTASLLIYRSKGTIFGGKFVKKNGEVRNFNGRIGVKKDLSGGGMNYQPALKGMVPIYENNSKGYRMVNIRTLSELSIFGKRFIVTD